MAEVISSSYTLSDSTLKTRPSSQAFYKSDRNSGLNDIQTHNQQLKLRQMRISQNKGYHDVESFKNHDSINFKKFNDTGDYRVSAPFRDYDNIIDPVSGFLSAGGDVDRQTGQSKIVSFNQISDKPNNRIPQATHSIRKDCPGAPPETNRIHEYEKPGMPWSQRHFSSARIRSILGGWTSKVDQTPDIPNACFVAKRSKSATTLSDRDQIAHNYIYSSSTQKAYNDIPFDQNLNPRKFPPTTTLESSADPVSQQSFSKRFDLPVQEWQHKKNSQDWYGLKPDNFNRVRPYTFSPKRSQQIPGYSGCIGAKNIDELDNPHESIKLFTVKRNIIPNYIPIGAPPDIPGYGGCRLIVQTPPVAAHSHQKQPPVQTTARVHCPMPVTPNSSEFRHEGSLSKMVTTVPPFNPFNKVELSRALSN